MAQVGPILFALLFIGNSSAQQISAGQLATGTISKSDRDRALGILENISKGIQETYYDPKMNGVDWNAVINTARSKIAASNSLNEAMTQVAVAVSSLNDSHTIFEPPSRPYHLDFGFQYQMFWDRCFVTRVRPGSDASSKGLKPSLEIVTINGIAPKRQNLENIEYLNQILDPRPEMKLEVKRPSGEKESIQIVARVTTSPDVANRMGAGVRYDVIRNYENVVHRMRMQLIHRGEVAF